MRSRKISATNIIVMAISLFMFAACSYPFDSGSSVELEAFVAELADFEDYTTWESMDYTIGASNSALDTFHMAADDNYSRRIFIDTPGALTENEYAIGTIIVLETFTWEDGVQKFADSEGVLAMVKRGGAFNSYHGGWEWFELTSDLSEITARGADVMTGACNSCHGQAYQQTGGADYVFPHPTAFVAAIEDLADYSTWSQIDVKCGPNSLLGTGHKAYDAGAIRRIYKKQILSNPDTDAKGYPIGTIIVKEVQQDSDVTEIAAMVKRGGSFNEDYGKWEWFMLTPSPVEIEDRGADLMGGTCNTCHGQVTSATNGRDYVFRHSEDPFNQSEPSDCVLLVADAGPDQEVVTGGAVTLDGSGSSSANNDPLGYRWSFTSVPSGSTAALSSADEVNPTFVADVEGAYSIQLIVNDGLDDSSQDAVMITSAAASALVSFSTDIQSIFDNRCIACHASGGLAEDVMILTSDVSYSNLVNTPAKNSSLTRVVPGDSANSELYLRVSGTAEGSRMPLGGSLNAAEVDLIKAWIDEGALDN